MFSSRHFPAAAWLAFLGLVYGPFDVQAGVAPFEFRAGDRVVFLGATLLEREHDDVYLESLLTARFADKNLTFRNLAWSGDTVWGDSFGDTAKS